MGILTRFIEVQLFLKESLKFAKMYIVGSSERIYQPKIDFMLNISVKRHVLSDLYLI